MKQNSSTLKDIVNLLTRKEEIIWLAGLLEGEGSFWLQERPGNRRTAIRVGLRMTDQDVVQKAADIFPSRGRVRFEEKRDPNWKPTYCFDWCGLDAWKVMSAVLPYMGERRSERIRVIMTTPNLSHQPKEKL